MKTDRKKPPTSNLWGSKHEVNGFRQFVRGKSRDSKLTSLDRGKTRQPNSISLVFDRGALFAKKRNKLLVALPGKPASLRSVSAIVSLCLTLSRQPCFHKMFAFAYAP